MGHERRFRAIPAMSLSPPTAEVGVGHAERTLGANKRMSPVFRDTSLRSATKQQSFEMLMMDAYCSSAGTLVPPTKVRPKPRWQPALFLQEEKIKRFVDLIAERK
jgi:hypothetical protein